MNKTPSLLVFDSGMGGLSILAAVKARCPYLDFHYLFDNAGYPYGELPAEVLIERVDSLIAQYVNAHQIDLVIIACNTASTIVLPRLRANLTIPVIGVVPAIKPAGQRAKKAIGLIATPATVKRAYTKDLIQRFANQVPVYSLGSTELVMMAEKKLRGVKVDLESLAVILAPIYPRIDVAVLGCTHFPLLKQEIAQVMPGVELIDSGEAIAKRVEAVLGQAHLERVEEKKAYPIYSSAPPWQEDALNGQLDSLGFQPIRCLHYPRV
ncbi:MULTISPECIES: glutamate racemase [unclassified Vibrio]|uniref:Glutamate racemase n=1 Tax=Vibrio sp. HB236076 TaxID=3232307 RepID=A0AB39HE56_9VIBR|nr:glutamate racemase [Vibrio sp. HB161653]MDP5255756.1 glutamate racemase [Vibrio sp. HB161653]